MTHIRNAWYVAAWTHEIASERPVGVCVLNEPIVIWRTAAGSLTAFEDRCIHRLAPLSLGRCEGEKLRCMYHGLVYNREGCVVEIPGQDRVSNSLRVRTYPVVERYGWIWVWMGDAAVDESLIPSVIGLEHSDCIFGHGQLDYAAEARFVNDNLLDLSHVSFLHGESVGASGAWARERPEVTEHARGVRIKRWIRGERAMSGADDDARADIYSCCEFFVPGVFLLTSNVYPVGTADALHGQSPDGTLVKKGFALQAITPLTEKTTRSFYIMAVHRDHGGEAQRDFTMATVARVFAEDKRMIEAQQRIIDATPGWRFTATNADLGVVLFNRLVAKLVEQECAPSASAQPSCLASPHSASRRN